MAIHEECGVFGVMSTKRENVACIICPAAQRTGKLRYCCK